MLPVLCLEARLPMFIIKVAAGRRILVYISVLILLKDKTIGAD